MATTADRRRDRSAEGVRSAEIHGAVQTPPGMSGMSLQLVADGHPGSGAAGSQITAQCVGSNAMSRARMHIASAGVPLGAHGTFGPQADAQTSPGRPATSDAVER